MRLNSFEFACGKVSATPGKGQWMEGGIRWSDFVSHLAGAVFEPKSTAQVQRRFTKTKARTRDKP
jgi:hypothetical protein